MYAVIRTGGKQYRVAPNDILNVEKVSGDVGDIIQFSEVLMIGDDADATIGSPVIDGACVAAEVLEQGRDKKIIVFKKKRRHNYRRKAGHRQELTTIQITEILTDNKAPSKTKAKPKAVEAKKDSPEKEPGQSKTPDDGQLKQIFEAPKGKSDDLKKISGVGPKLEEKLNALGVTTFQQVANFTDEDVARVDKVLNFKGRITREDWISQAKEFLKDT
ncbi:MAG: 50S ribosomal protein L21 [Pseudomonadota bacterium]